MTRPLLPFDKRRGAKRPPRKAPLKVYKAGAETLVPLCGPWRVTASEFTEGCHRELHRIGVKSFEKKYSVDLKSIAKKLFGERAE